MCHKFQLTATLIFLLILNSSCTNRNSDLNNRRVSFNRNWQFYLEDSLIKDATQIQKRTLTLPHDWSIEGSFDENHPATFSGGALPGGTGWYTKSFKLPESDKGKNFYIDFDGVYMNSEVWINGHYLGKRPNGYISFRYELTPHLKFGDAENAIKVKVDNSKQPNSRWYSGSGIYRNVWLVKTDQLHVAHWGTYITNPVITPDTALLHIETTIDNDYDKPKEATLKTSILNGDLLLGEVEKAFSLAAGDNQTLKQELVVNSPELWSVESPKLYRLISEVYIDNEVVDSYETPFGIRQFSFNKDNGFKLNGQSIKIKGVCNHHDLGALGAAINQRALERRLEILKDMGVNAIRTAHNPPSPELLQLCDEMGFLVMDEVFDMWKLPKSKYDYSMNWDTWHEKDLEDFIRRDRNHPSIFMWSIGNEILEQWDSTGIELTKELASKVKSLDKTRPVTTANNPPSPHNHLNIPDVLDVIGYNYAHAEYENHPKVFPDRPFIATETTSALATRGYYDKDSDSIKRWPVRWDLLFTGGNPGNTVSAYDQVSAPWGSTHEETWRIVKRNKYLSGMFVWTGFDYLGEPTPYVWPSRSSYFGIIDLAGFPKDVYYMYQSEWTDKPVLHVFPHWNWEEGEKVDVWAYYSKADEVELFLNDVSLGVRKKDDEDFHVMWETTFTPGTLKAVSRKNGEIVLTREIKTSDSPYQIEMQPDRKHIAADGEDLSFVVVTIRDKEGTLVPYATNEVKFSIEGEGEIVGVDNGDPTSHSSFKTHSVKAFYGKCLVIVKSTEKQGKVRLSARAGNLKEKTIELNTQ